MKYTAIILIIGLACFAGCTSNTTSNKEGTGTEAAPHDHGDGEHSHGEGSHSHSEGDAHHDHDHANHEQEEFTLSGDSLVDSTTTRTHDHEHGEDHDHDHQH